MAAPLTDIHVQHVLNLGLKTIRSNPKKHLKDIFGDVLLDPHAALYGQDMIDQIETWIMSTKVPVILGFDLVSSELPSVTVNLSSSTPHQEYIGDESVPGAEPLDWQEMEVVVPKFVPSQASLAEDRQSIIIAPPADMAQEMKDLFIPGLLVRDGRGQMFTISLDKDCNTILITRDTPVADVDLTGLEIVSPVINARYSRGAMVYNDTVTIVVHGHQSRQEGVWLYNIVMWTLLKFRPVLTATFGLDLSVPSASDFARDESYAGEQVWRRYITVTCTNVWSWESARQKDVLAMLLGIQYDRVLKT